MNTVFTIQHPVLSPVFWGILLVATFCCCSLSMATPPRYHLDLSFQPEQHQLQAKASIALPPGEEWRLYTGGLDIQEVTVQEEGRPPFSLPLPQGDSLHMYAARNSQQITITYSLQIPPDSGENLISPDGIVLTSNWHPQPDRNMLFSLSATLPPGFQGISESDTLPGQEENGSLVTSFSQPVRSIHLAAGPYQVQKEEIHKGLTLSTWFFPEDQLLSQGYLDAGKAYLIRYEKEIGPFPYGHYAIVSNRLPSGFGMPTFTLLGQVVLRLPFIKETSLGHEIVHSWFGNSIEVTDGSGNWCEGLTSYLADFSYAEDRGEGAAHRKASLINYQSYVQQDSAVALQDFHSASHQQATAKAIRAVGYNRGAMLFHQLHGLLGPEYFTQGLRLFASTYQGRSASWKDMQKAFETASGKDLEPFFVQQLTSNDMPAFVIKDISSEDRQDSSLLYFTLEQASASPYSLRVPIRVETAEGEKTFLQEITEKETKISLSLPGPPLSFVLDPEYDLFRTLAPAELPPVWSRFLGTQKKLLLLESQKAAPALAPFIRWAEKQGWSVADTKSVTNQQLSENSILFLGAGGPVWRSLFADAPTPSEGFRLLVQNNPLNEKEMVVFVGSSSAEETEAVLPKLSHYGKYSSLFFLQGKIQDKKVAASDNGLDYLLENLPNGAPAKPIAGFEQILTELAKNRVIYLGETHDSLADHLLQLRIIQGLQKKGLDLAIAMEMFPESSQQSLDDYIAGKKDMEEAAFLRASHWFEVWRHDWRLFRPIFNFCRRHKIPVYGINVDREIVKSVFADGNTDGLSQEQREAVAPDRDLSLDGYTERLRLVHGLHADIPHGNGKGLAGFIQSQAIWDETMAENIVRILKDNPGKTVVVIAGTQHTRKDSGIPPRVSRRLPVEQTSVLNLYGDNPPAQPERYADFFFLAEPRYLKSKGKIGITLETEDNNGAPRLRITAISPTGKAGEGGIEKNDILLTIDGQPVSNMEDIGILMMDSKAGDELHITILREKEGRDPEKKELSIKLSDLSRMMPHP
ncbi:MAG: ChaN family lipoprotein [Proteobacteria bacterium]|nr:ChaN family lipoprotein [Pseudomonadota bacterium]MBU1419044.1 ChaN family lipoprotein [Pseudomonadota bacterium]MBU1456867.1 ChaN family lipoprotein [Pseudomonadota bacterium]